MSRPIRFFPFLAATVLMASCDSGGVGEPGSSALTVQRDSAEGVEIVTVSGSFPELALRPLKTLGSAVFNDSGELGPEDFSWVSSAAITRSGSLLVADLERQEILVFDPEDGSFLRSVGRAGDGPGEFESLFSVAAFGDDLLAMDIGNGRTTRLSMDDGWIEQWRAAGRLVAPPVDFRLYPVGPDEVYQWAYSMDEGLEVPVWRRYFGNQTPDEIPRTTPSPERGFPDRVVCQMGRGFSWFPHPFAPVGLSHPLPGRQSVVATTDSYQFAILDSVGDTVRLVKRSVDALPTSDAAWEPLEREFEVWLEDKNRAECEPEALPRPENRPPIASLMVDVKGRVWVERSLDQTTVWEIFESDGTPVGSVPGFDHDRDRTVPFLGEDFVVWMTRDELDLPRVHIAAWVE